MSFACAQEYASFPVLMPRWLPVGSHLAYSLPVFAPNRPIGSAAHPRTPEVLLAFTKDTRHHQVAIEEFAGQQPLKGVHAVTFDHHALLASVGPGETPSGARVTSVQVAAVISGHSYVVSGTIALKTAERIAVSFFQ